MARTFRLKPLYAGYIGSVASYDTVDIDQTMSLFEITGDDVVIRRFDKDGGHALQESVGCWHDGWESDFGRTLDSSIQVSGLQVSGNSLELSLPSNMGRYGFEVDSSAYVSVKNPGTDTYRWDIENLDGVGVATVTPVADTQGVTIRALNTGSARISVVNTRTNETASFCIQVVAAAEEIIVETNGFFYRLVDTFTEGKRYMLVDRNTSNDSVSDNGKGYAITAQGSGTELAVLEVMVGSYRAGMPFVMYTADGLGGETDRPIWYYEGGHIRNASRKTSYLAVDANKAYYNNVGYAYGVSLLKPNTTDQILSYNWALNLGVRSDLTGENYVLDFFNYPGNVEWRVAGSSHYDADYYSHVYAYEETLLYASGDVSDRTGCVPVGAGTDTETGSYIVKTWSNGRVEYVPLTMSMLSASDTDENLYAEGVHRNVTVTCNGVVICTDYTLTVGSEKTITVGSYDYYRLVDEFTSNKTYLIVNRNSKGDGYLMETHADGGSVDAEKVVVGLDADGVPCILTSVIEAYCIAEAKVSGATAAQEKLRKEWNYKQKEGNWCLRQEGAYPACTCSFGSAHSFYLRVQSVTSAELVIGYNYPDMAKNPVFKTPGDINGYTSIFTKAGFKNGEGTYVDVEFYLQFHADSSKPTFYADRDYDRVLGREVHAYEKVSCSTAVVSTLGNVGSVKVNAGDSAKTGTRIQITRQDGTVEFVEVTCDMLSGADLSKPGTYTGVTVSYSGVAVSDSYTLTVVGEDETGNAEYPAPGTVKADKQKDTSEFDFEETGVARIDLSVAGAPASVPLDVLVIVDTSSSVVLNTMENGETRLEAMRHALDNLIDELAQPNLDGSLPDIKLAITQFNGYNYFSNVNALNGHVPPDPDVHPSSSNQTIVDYTDVFELQNFNTATITNYSCTNYDVAFQHAYKMVERQIGINKANGEENRDQVVIFMTDGICYQYNYISNKYLVDNSTDNIWKKWMLGTLTDDEINTYVPEAAKDWYHPDGKQWMAEAIKGDPNQTYKVIEKTDSAYDVGADYDKSVNLKNVPGLGATMYTIGFGLRVDGTAGEMVGKQILSLAASDESKYYSADEADELYDAFHNIGLSVRSTCSYAQLNDKLGAAFDLQMGTVINSNGVKQTFKPTITVKAYDVYSITDVGQTINGVTVTESMVGMRKSNIPSKILETVTFNDAGDEAYSDQLSGNIMSETGVIAAKYFLYNTNKNAEGVSPGAEEFAWNIGEITEQELVLSYYVYLEDSMGDIKQESGVPKGTYPTNEYAQLSYLNLDNEWKYEDLESPVLEWDNAGISYGYYLVNVDSEVITDENTGATGSFNDKVTVGTKTGTTVNLNVGNSVTPDTLPDGYVLYDPSALGSVNVHSGIDNYGVNNCGGAWVILNSTTTYITGYGGDPSTSANHSSATGDFSDTTVWFAVIKLQIMPDVVVIDYGLPVDISVLVNDGLGVNSVKAVGPYDESNKSLDGGYDTSLASGFGTTYDGVDYGSAAVNGSKVRYTLNTMEMNGYDKFLYAVEYKAPNGTVYYCYASVTVIPATTLYFEESFLNFDNLIWKNDSWVVDETKNGAVWGPAGTLVNKDQAEDRPGRIETPDANNFYGYDGAYKQFIQYSQGYSKMALVDKDTAAQASFKFYGTGFDVISYSSSTTGVVFVEVYEINENGERGERVRANVVDTYYGYDYGLYKVTYIYENLQWNKYVGTKAPAGTAVNKVELPDNPVKDQKLEGYEYCWVVTPTDEALYQVPVIEVEGLGYGHYEAVIQATYEPILDHVAGGEDGNYYFYLDAIRIYDPADDGASDGAIDVTIENAYRDDHEAWPSYIELRNNLINSGTFYKGNDSKGIVYIDGRPEVGKAHISDYEKYGPNNEVYLAKGQSIAFMLSCPANIDQIHIGIKSANGSNCSYTIANVGAGGTAVKTATLPTATDMYYDITDLRSGIIVITNTGDGLISLTNIKSTYTSNPGASRSASGGMEVNETYVYMNQEAASLVLDYLNTPVDGDVPEGGENIETQPDAPEIPGQTEPGIPETGDEMGQSLSGMTVAMLAAVVAMVVVACCGNRGFVAGRKERT